MLEKTIKNHRNCVPVPKIQKSIDVEGCSVEEAIKKAIKILRVSREDISVKILCEEKKGLFGMAGAKPAKISVTLRRNKKSNKITKYVLSFYPFTGVLFNTIMCFT